MSKRAPWGEKLGEDECPVALVTSHHMSSRGFAFPTVISFVSFF